MISPVLCPSYRCEVGSKLIGVVTEIGLSYFPDELCVNQDFVDKANIYSNAEKRFRFAGECLNKGCLQWQDNRCSVIEKVLESELFSTSLQQSERCNIKDSCRWFLQEGEKACSVCPKVVTDISNLE